MNRTELAAVWPPTVTAATAAGHEPMTPMQAIRLKCLDCTCYQVQEVRLCEAVKCPLWPFRARRNPYRKPPANGGAFPQRAAGGTWIASEMRLRKTPAIDGDFSESGHSTNLGSARSPAEAAARPETRLQQALPGERAARDTPVPEKGTPSESPALKASVGQSGAVCADASGVEA